MCGPTDIRAGGPARARGFSLLEVLITMAVSALALLGAAVLTLHAMKFNQSGRYRTQAVVLSGDIAERIEANKDGALAGSYEVAAGVAVAALTDCAASACSTSDLAIYDLAQWVTAVGQLLPGGSAQITQSVATNPTTYQIVVSWVDRRDGKVGSGQSATENFSYTTSKTVYH